MGYTYKKLLVIYLKFNFNWVCFYLLKLATLPRKQYHRGTNSTNQTVIYRPNSQTQQGEASITVKENNCPTRHI